MNRQLQVMHRYVLWPSPRTCVLIHLSDFRAPSCIRYCFLLRFSIPISILPTGCVAVRSLFLLTSNHYGPFHSL